MKIGELLLEKNRITKTQLSQALRAQEVYGGKLGTNLVELGFLTETDLTQFLAVQLKIPAAQPADFNNIPKKVLSLIPKEFAQKHRVIPLGFESHKLKVAFGDPLDWDAREKTAFRAGHTIIPLVAPEILINYALEKFYHLHLEKRYLTLSDNDELSFNDVLMRNQMETPPQERKPSVGSIAKRSDLYWLKEMSLDLAKASSKDEVFRALFRFLETLFSSMTVFMQNIKKSLSKS
jgi:hypothetical protein